MTATALLRNARTPSNALRAAAALWIMTAVLGQLAFAAYIASFYGGAALGQRFERWNEVLVGGYVPGGVIGNVALGVHLLLALVITIGGPLQLVPQLRAIGAHRWNGRVYVATALLVTLSGLYAVWTRGTAGSSWMRVGISLNGVLILVSAALAWRYARARAIADHRRWALRTFLLVSGVWFFRIGLMLWILVHGGPVGVGSDFDGPFVRTWAFGCYLLPVLLLQGFLWAEGRPVARDKYVIAALLAGLALATGGGIVSAIVGMWLPRM
jgi:hypothetical protein